MRTTITRGKIIAMGFTAIATATVLYGCKEEKPEVNVQHELVDVLGQNTIETFPNQSTCETQQEFLAGQLAKTMQVAINYPDAAGNPVKMAALSGEVEPTPETLDKAMQRFQCLKAG